MKEKKYVQGLFRPLHSEKYIGNHKPRYLSSYELHFFRWADKNPNIVKWSSESIAIPYRCPIDGRVHRYLVDNFILLKTKDGIKKYLVEIKPAKQTIPPSTKNRKNKNSLIYEQIMYARNCAKWEAAEAWASKNDCHFTILTEKHLQIK
jgi:hypothetical protein